ncbi:MAG: DNA polymerase III subunit delta' [Sulfurimonas sp.]|nr:DNA polymerase III subunit delta' [Sulfurimonas sp.]MBU3938621.1 DNA polymerase III subunit delta' [bacterium]MBU4024688.1 DNA polymerase III subunit delta' [bacterium]MBU4059543.1 DNA polymerase III subunit delta' [bacterium]MBU4110977.1 DNA polymerase III subunit delta' [bacterium]
MLLHNSHASHILISSEIEHEVERLKSELHGSRVVAFVEDEFKIENAKAVVAEAYISESQTKYIILASKNFNIVSQNSLLKVLEEPPRNIEFIIISPTKSNLLPTVRSRLPILQGKKTQREISININLAKTDYKEIFEFLKENARVSKSRAQELVEELYYRATVIDTLALTSLQLENFDRAYRLLELNSRPISVLAMILMSFTREK